MATAKPAKRRGTKSAKGWRTAATSDRHELYESSVQSPDEESAFIDRVFRSIRGRTPVTLREDFCGTHFLSGTWVKRRAANRAIGFDLHRPTVAWGQSRRATELTAAQRKRLDIRIGDVCTARSQPVDVIAAFNFSYFLFKKREQLVAYFKHARSQLKRDGVMFLDCYGGHGSFSEQTEERDFDGFTYQWHTERYDPVSGDVLNHIHFVFPDGTKVRKAFTYDWRLWTIPEIRECLDEAGFRRTHVYWEGTDHASGEGDGIFRRTTVGEACAGWIAYIAAEK
ncbi:MAG: class I SAM-dependent methyltransferase [Planctomycetes bacterium]|nr:class I SAM-dependent methyltransferase [Planctomycetota bacterium]